MMLTTMLIGALIIGILIVMVPIVLSFISQHRKTDTLCQPKASVTPKAYPTVKNQTDWYPDPDKSLSEIGEELGKWIAGESNPRLDKAFREGKLGGSRYRPMTPIQERELEKIRATLRQEPPDYNLYTIDDALNERYAHFGPPSFDDDIDDLYNHSVFEEIYKVFARAQLLEKQKEPLRALNYYLMILLNVVPLGDAYYLRPAILLERYKHFNAALAVCKLRKVYLREGESGYEQKKAEWDKREARLKNRMNASSK